MNGVRMRGELGKSYNECNDMTGVILRNQFNTETGHPREQLRHTSEKRGYSFLQLFDVNLKLDFLIKTFKLY